MENGSGDASHHLGEDLSSIQVVAQHIRDIALLVLGGLEQDLTQVLESQHSLVSFKRLTSFLRVFDWNEGYFVVPQLHFDVF